MENLLIQAALTRVTLHQMLFERRTQKGYVAQEGSITKRHEKTLGGYKYIHYLVCGDNLLSVYISQ